MTNKIGALSDAMLAAGVPAGFTLREHPGPTWTVTYTRGTTAEQQSVGDDLVARFDPTDAAQQAREDAASPQKAVVREQAAGAVQANSAYLALAAPSNEQIATQVRRLTQQNSMIVARLLQLP